MTHVSLGELKSAYRDRAARRSSGGLNIPTPIPSAMSAVRRYHIEGREEASAYLRRSFEQSPYWGPGGRTQARSWARSIVEAFGAYCDLAEADNRAALAGGVTSEIPLGSDSVRASCDVVLLDEQGYVGRYPLWDVPIPAQDEAATLAAPIAAAMGEGLGLDRVAAVEIWHLRSSTQFVIPRDDALRRLPLVRQIVADYVS